MSKQTRTVLLLVTLKAEGDQYLNSIYGGRCINVLRRLIRHIKEIPPEEDSSGQAGFYKEKAEILKVDIIGEEDLSELKEW